MGIFQNKTVGLILGSILVAGLTWYIFLRDTTPAPLLETNDLTVTTGADREVVETLLQLRAITLSGTILSDPAFLQLTDTGTQIIPEPVGRVNPFLPFGLRASSTPGTVSATTSTTTRR